MGYFQLARVCFGFFLFFWGFLNAHSIVFVHIGPSIPVHVPNTIAQARLFNKECPIYLIANKNALEKNSAQLDTLGVIPVTCESLSPSPAHQRFHACPEQNWGGNGFWVYTSERFFYLQEFVSQNNLHDIFHLENDIMLYVNLEDLLPVFKKHYNGMIAATFENDHRCVPGFMYISNPDPLIPLVESFPTCISIDKTDMESIARFKNLYHKVLIDHLPIVLPEYACDHPLEFFSEKSKEPESFSNHFDDFGSVFDAAAWGIYLGGSDSTFHADSNPGRILPYCVFKPSYFTFYWKVDQEGRRIPFVNYNGKEMRINNLHITNKIKIPSFSSLSN